jgi:hypothetical protein
MPTPAHAAAMQDRALGVLPRTCQNTKVDFLSNVDGQDVLPFCGGRKPGAPAGGEDEWEADEYWLME